MLSLVGGAVVAVFLHLKTHRGVIPAIAVVTALGLVLGVGAVYVLPPLVTAAEQSRDPLLRYTVGRSPESADKREEIFADQIELYERGDLLGIGPAATKHELGNSFAGVAKEAHNDYLATLVERGPVRSARRRGTHGGGHRPDQRDHPAPADCRGSPPRCPCPPPWAGRVRRSHSRR